MTRSKMYHQKRKEDTKGCNGERKEQRLARERAHERARARVLEENESITWFDTKRYFREHGVVTQCLICNDSNHNGECDMECFDGKVPPVGRCRDSNTKKLTRLYCNAVYGRTEAARDILNNQDVEPNTRNQGLWMLFPDDKVKRIAEPSKLEHVGGLTMKLDVRWMSFKYVLDSLREDTVPIIKRQQKS